MPGEGPRSPLRAAAEALADDLHRFGVGDPILARPTPAWERAWKWARRRKAVVALLAVSMAAVASIVLLVVWHNVSLRGKLDVALERGAPGPPARASTRWRSAG